MPRSASEVPFYLHAVADAFARASIGEFSRDVPPLANLHSRHGMQAGLVRHEHERTSRIMRNIRRIDERLMDGLIQRFAVEHSDKHPIARKIISFTLTVLLRRETPRHNGPTETATRFYEKSVAGLSLSYLHFSQVARRDNAAIATRRSDEKIERFHVRLLAHHVQSPQRIVAIRMRYSISVPFSASEWPADMLRRGGTASAE